MSVGIFALEESRLKRDIRGDHVEVAFKIIDQRSPLASQAVPSVQDYKQVVMTTAHGPYNVTLVLKVRITRSKAIMIPTIKAGHICTDTEGR